MREILTVLEADAHASVERIATLTGIDEAAVREQIAAWEASGVIRRYKAVVDWDRYGDERVTAFVDVTVAPERGAGSTTSPSASPGSARSARCTWSAARRTCGSRWRGPR